MKAKPTMTPEEEAKWAEYAQAGELFTVVGPAPSYCRECNKGIDRYARNFCSPMCRRVWWLKYHEMRKQEHGTVRCYRMYGCRCEPCRAAQSAAAKAAWARRKAC